MGKFDLYKLPLSTLSLGTHQYEYDLGNQFFKDIDGTEVQKGNVHVLLTVKNTGEIFELNFDISGVVQIPCDRCLDDMDYEVSTHEHLYVKFGKEYSEENDDVVIIPEEEGEINLAWFLYEFIALTIPLKHVHAPGICNKAMSFKLRKHPARRMDDDEEDDGLGTGFEDEAEELDEVENETDPRWDELKKIIDNN